MEDDRIRHYVPQRFISPAVNTMYGFDSVDDIESNHQPPRTPSSASSFTTIEPDISNETPNQGASLAAMSNTADTTTEN
eukprot:7031382-Ditylum_brightwellii.AAC.1